MKKNITIVFIGIILITYASVNLASKNTIYYFTTSEITTLDIENGERIKLGGFVVKNTIEKNGTSTNFSITDGNLDVSVVFEGFVPDLFQENMGVILDGNFIDNIFYSDDMLVKHDNEYISSEGEIYDVETYKE